MDLDTQQRIDKIIIDAHIHMQEIFDINEHSPDDRIYQTMRFIKNNSVSYLDAYIHYYMGVFEGLLISFFLEEFDRYPIEAEQEFISNSFNEKWKDFVDVVELHATERFKDDQRLGR